MYAQRVILLVYIPMSFGYSARFFMIDIAGFALSTVFAPLVGEAVSQSVAGVWNKEDTEERAKLRRKKKRTKSSRVSLLFSTLMVAAVLIMCVYGPSSAKYAHS